MNSRPADPGALAAALAWAVGTWAAVGTVALTGASTTSRLGLLPPVWLLFALAAVACGAVYALRLSAPAAAPLWLALVALLPWVPGPIPAAFLLFDGPLGWLPCITPVIVVAIEAGRGRWAQLLAAPIRTQLGIAGLCAACFYGAAAWRIAPVIPGGDEPHYLIITQSLLTDGDLRIENNHARRDYLSYVQADLKPDYLRRGRDGAIYSIHPPGLAVLVLPAFALGGYLGVTIFLVLISAAGSVVARRAAIGHRRCRGVDWLGCRRAQRSFLLSGVHHLSRWPRGAARAGARRRARRKGSPKPSEAAVVRRGAGRAAVAAHALCRTGGAAGRDPRRTDHVAVSARASGPAGQRGEPSDTIGRVARGPP
jgi:hypothetical protein